MNSIWVQGLQNSYRAWVCIREHRGARNQRLGEGMERNAKRSTNVHGRSVASSASDVRRYEA